MLEPNPKADELLLKTGKPYDKLKMPTFYLTDEQVHQLVVFVISNRDKLITEKLMNKSDTPAARQLARGRELTTKFNCVSCHWIENNAPQIQQYYKADEILEKAPPPLRGEGNKVQFSWLFNFLKNPTRLRYTTVLRMPQFTLSDKEASGSVGTHLSRCRGMRRVLSSAAASPRWPMEARSPHA